MELKKSDKANLEKRRFLFFEIGMLIALGFGILAFELKISPTEADKADGPLQAAIEEEIVPITRHEEPPPPPPEPPKVTDILEIVSDDVQVDTQIHIDIEVDLMTEISIFEYTQEEMEEEDEIVLFAVIEDKPMFNGKDADVGFREWVSSRIVYPAVAAENGITGRVITEFTIDRDGSITDIRILRGADPLLDAEALRILRMSPKWTPGKQRGRAVRVRYQFPFVFHLQ